MKTKTQFILLTSALAILLCWISACKKDATTSVNGRVTDATTGIAVPNATVYIQRKSTNCFSCNAGAFAAIKADANGSFAYSFEAEKGFAYSIAAEATNYFSNKPTGGISIDSYKNNNILVPLQPKAWLKLHVINTSPFDGGDKIAVNGEINYPEQFYGMSVDTFTTKVVNGNQEISIYYEVTKNSVANKYTKSIYCAAFDTTLYTINY